MKPIPLVLLTLLLTPTSLRAEERDMTIEEFLQKLSTVPDVVSRKDPFVKANPPFEAARNTGDEIVMSAPVLERYPVRDYQIIATLLGDQYPRALVKLPARESSRVLIIRERDKFGNKGGVITKITKDSVVILQSVRSPLGFVDKAEINLRVGEGGSAAGSTPK